MTTKKNSSHVDATDSKTSASLEGSTIANPATTPPLSPPGDLPPAQGAPSTPTGWRASPTKAKRGFRGQRPKGDQITNATTAASELQKSTTYVADFGAAAPDPNAIAFTLTNAAKWRDHWATAQKWYEYCSEQRIAWENEAMGQMATLQPPFDYAASRNPSLATKYRATARFMDATKAIGQRAAASRKAATAEKKAAAKAATATPAASKTLN